MHVLQDVDELLYRFANSSRTLHFRGCTRLFPVRLCHQHGPALAQNRTGGENRSSGLGSVLGKLRSDYRRHPRWTGPHTSEHKLVQIDARTLTDSVSPNTLVISLGFAPEISTLDKGKTGGCTLATMMRVLTIGLAVVVILSCATVLITPDPGDDFNGILHQHHSVKGHKLLAAPDAALRPFALATFQSFTPPIPTLRSSTPRLLALVCVRLC